MEGAPALVMAVDKFAMVELETQSKDNFSVDAPDINISNKDFKIHQNGSPVLTESLSELQRQKLNFFTNTIQIVWNYLNKKGYYASPGFHIKLDTSNLFEKSSHIKLGLGSSAALTAALIGGLLKFSIPSFDETNKRSMILELAILAHRKAQGEIGSGIDIAASVYGGLLSYKIPTTKFKQPSVLEKLILPANLYIFPVWTSSSASTRVYVEKYKRFKLKNSLKFQTLIEKMTEISQTGIESFKNGNTSIFMQKIKSYYEHLKKLGELCEIPIISLAHQEIAEIAYSNGAVYKPSGAGGGDFGLIFGISPTLSEQITNRLSEKGFRIMPLSINYKGVETAIQEVS
jgi:phosphomevalonate kinase